MWSPDGITWFCVVVDDVTIQHTRRRGVQDVIAAVINGVRVMLLGRQYQVNQRVLVTSCLALYVGVRFTLCFLEPSKPNNVGHGCNLQIANQSKWCQINCWRFHSAASERLVTYFIRASISLSCSIKNLLSWSCTVVKTFCRDSYFSESTPEYMNAV